jgi:hypothetical protein
MCEAAHPPSPEAQPLAAECTVVFVGYQARAVGRALIEGGRRCASSVKRWPSAPESACWARSAPRDNTGLIMWISSSPPRPAGVRHQREESVALGLRRASETNWASARRAIQRRNLAMPEATKLSEGSASALSREERRAHEREGGARRFRARPHVEERPTLPPPGPGRRTG